MHLTSVPLLMTLKVDRVLVDQKPPWPTPELPLSPAMGGSSSYCWSNLRPV